MLNKVEESKNCYLQELKNRSEILEYRLEHTLLLLKMDSKC